MRAELIISSSGGADLGWTMQWEITGPQLLAQTQHLNYEPPTAITLSERKSQQACCSSRDVRRGERHLYGQSALHRAEVEVMPGRTPTQGRQHAWPRTSRSMPRRRWAILRSQSHTQMWPLACVGLPHATPTLQASRHTPGREYLCTVSVGNASRAMATPRQAACHGLHQAGGYVGSAGGRVPRV
jgi:hypothetical protein